jgi:hypothetical protein
MSSLVHGTRAIQILIGDVIEEPADKLMEVALLGIIATFAANAMMGAEPLPHLTKELLEEWQEKEGIVNFSQTS